MSQVEIIHADADYAIGHWNNILLVVWFVNTTVEAVNNLARELDRLSKRHPEGMGLLTIVTDRAPLPVPEARQALAGFLTQSGGKILVSGLVQEGQGFRASAVRGVVSILNMMARQPFPHKVFASTWMAGKWIEATAREHADWSLPAGGVERAATEFKRRASTSRP